MCNELHFLYLGFVKVDQLKPGTAGKNLIVKVLTTDVVVDKNQNNRWQSQSPCVYSQPQITRVAETLVGDETGTIIFTTRNEQGSVNILPFVALA